MAEPGRTAGTGIAGISGEMDEEAPEITGLTVVGEKELPFTDMVRVFTYEDGVYLIEVDRVRGTLKDPDYEPEEADATEDSGASSETTGAAEAAESDTDGDDAVVVETDDAVENAADESGDSAEAEPDKTAALYSSDIVKYLVVPENVEIPAGLEKSVIVIRQPVDRTYVSSAAMLTLLEELEVLDMVGSVGLEAEEVDNETVREAMSGDEPAIVYGGAYDDWDLRTMITGKTNFIV